MAVNVVADRCPSRSRRQLDDIPAAKVVDIAVAVVVDTVRLATIAALRPGWSTCSPRGRDGHRRCRCRRRRRPRRRCRWSRSQASGASMSASAVPGETVHGLTRIAQAPLVDQSRVVGHGARVPQVVRLGIPHGGPRAQRGDGRLDRLTRLGLKDHCVARAGNRSGLDASDRQRGRLRRVTHRCGEAHDNLPRDMLGFDRRSRGRSRWRGFGLRGRAGNDRRAGQERQADRPRH